MAFPTKNWQNSPSTATPINAAALEDMETRVAAYSEEVGIKTSQLPSSAANGSVIADYVVAKVGSAIVATPSIPSGLLTHTGTEAEVGTVINAALTSLKGNGHLHLALGSVSTNDAEIVINEGLNKVNPFTPHSKLIITGDGSTKLTQGSSGKNCIKVENASTVDMSGFILSSTTEAKSALCFSNEGAESEMSGIGCYIDLYCESTSTSSPAVLLQNAHQNTYPRLFAVNPNNHGLRIENTSTTVNYGNSAFGIIYTYAKKEAPYACLSIVTTHHETYPNLLTFDFFSCADFAGYYGLYTLGAHSITFTNVDIESMIAPVWCDGNTEGAETRNCSILSGNIIPSEANPAITQTAHTSGNRIASRMAGGNTAIPIKDESPSNTAVNEYDLLLDDTASAKNIEVTNPATPITFRRIDGGVRSPLGTTRASVTYTGTHTFEPQDMGLLVALNASGATSFFLTTYANQKLPVGTMFHVYQAGTGLLTVKTNEGVTLHNPSGYSFTQYGLAQLWCVAENEWVISPLGQPLPTELAFVGPWEALTGTLSPKVETNLGGLSPLGARKEIGGNVCRLRGFLKVKTGEELKVGETLFTLPEGLRPPAHIDLLLSGSVILEIATTGVTVLSAAKTSGQSIILDGLSFNLT